eukprot:COSAG03_NODE_4221_length_1633_cov_23.236636_1_plen_450_part_10
MEGVLVPCAQKNDAKNPFDILNLDAAFMEALDHTSTYLGAGDYQTGEVEAARRVRLAFTQLVKKDHVDKGGQGLMTADLVDAVRELSTVDGREKWYFTLALEANEDAEDAESEGEAEAEGEGAEGAEGGRTRGARGSMDGAPSNTDRTGDDVTDFRWYESEEDANKENSENEAWEAENKGNMQTPVESPESKPRKLSKKPKTPTKEKAQEKEKKNVIKRPASFSAAAASRGGTKRKRHSTEAHEEEMAEAVLSSLVDSLDSTSEKGKVKRVKKGETEFGEVSVMVRQGAVIKYNDDGMEPSATTSGTTITTHDLALRLPAATMQALAHAVAAAAASGKKKKGKKTAKKLAGILRDLVKQPKEMKNLREHLEVEGTPFFAPSASRRVLMPVRTLADTKQFLTACKKSPVVHITFPRKAGDNGSCLPPLSLSLPPPPPPPPPPPLALSLCCF